MRRINALSAALLLASWSGVASAQAPAPTPANRASLETQNNTFVYTNGQGAITAATLNPLLGNYAASMATLLDPNVFLYTQTYLTAPIFAAQTGYCYANGSSPITCSTSINGASISGTNVLALSLLQQIPAQTVIGNRFNAQGDISTAWTVPNSTDTIIPLVHGTVAEGDYACYSDSLGTLKDCGPIADNFAATAPISVSFPSGIPTFALNYDSAFALSDNKLALAPIASGALLGNSSGSAAEPAAVQTGSGVLAALGNPLNGSGGVLGAALASGDLFIGDGSGIAAGVPMSGDATISNTGTFTLATSGVTAGIYGDGTHSAQVTFDVKGRATSASSVTITHASGDLALSSLGANVAELLSNPANGANGPVSQVLISSIPSLTIPGNSFLSLGYSAAGDSGAGFVWTHSTSADPSAIQDASGTWWGLAPSEADKPVIFALGAVCDYNFATGNNDAPAINQAIDWRNWLVTAGLSSPSASVNLGGKNCSSQQPVHMQSSVWLRDGQISALSTPLSATASITAVNPAVVTVPGFALQTNDIVYFPASDTLPTGLIAGRHYYAYRASGLQADQFELSTQYIGTSTPSNIPLVSTASGTAASGQSIQIAWANTDNSYSKVQISIPQSTIGITANSADIAWNNSHGTAISALTVGDQINFSAVNGTLPSELQTGPFYVHSVNTGAGTFEVTLTSGGGGSAVVPTTSPAGIFEAADANVPATVTWPNHGLTSTQQIYFTCWAAPGGTCTLPTGITANTTYFVLATNLATNTFEFSATSGGSPVVTSGFVQGVMVAHKINPVTITIGSKTVVNWTGSNLRAGDILTFQGTLPTGMTAGQAYYVSNANGTLTANSAEIRSCRDGATGCSDLVTSGTSSNITAEWTGGEMFPPHDIDASGTFALGGYLGDPPVGMIAIPAGTVGAGLQNFNVNGGLLPSITDISNLSSLSVALNAVGAASFGNYGLWNGGDVQVGPSSVNWQQSPLLYSRTGMNVYNATPANAEKTTGIPNIMIPVGASDSIFDGIQNLSYSAANFYSDSHSPDIVAINNHCFQGASANQGAWSGFKPVCAALNFAGAWVRNEQDNASVIANVNSATNTGMPSFVVLGNYTNDSTTTPTSPSAPGSWGETADFIAATQFDVSALSTFDQNWNQSLTFGGNNRFLTSAGQPTHYALSTSGSGAFSSVATNYFAQLNSQGLFGSGVPAALAKDIGSGSGSVLLDLGSASGLTFSGSTYPTLSGPGIAIGGGTGPTLPTNGQGAISVAAGNGLFLGGKGSVNDVVIINASRQAALEVPTGTNNVKLPSLTTAGIVTNDATGHIGTETGITPAQCPAATSGAIGCAKPDGTTITVSGGVLTAVGAATTSIDAGGATSITNGTPGTVLIDNAGKVGIGISAASIASLTTTDQTLSGGANITAAALTTGNITVDCGANPGQYVANTGAFTITAPSNDGMCDVQIENGVGAGAVTFSGFSEGSNTGDPLDTTSGHKFLIGITRIHGTSHYLVSALQ